MRYPRRMSASRSQHGSAKQDFWLSFSDLMSAMVLVFILVLFYVLYRYFTIQAALQDELDRMLVIEAALSTKEAELTDAQLTLDSREGELTDAQKELARQQLMLNLAEQAMEDTEAELQEKQEALDKALALLGEREDSLASLQAELDTKQSQIEDQEAQLAGQQQQLEALVGVRSRIIQSLSQTLKDNKISAAVDPVSGAIMLESDVLFAYGSAELTSEGKAYIDKFLPAYLSVILSAENEAFVSEIIVEGHTDTVDTYIKNLRLSQNRAYAVAEYVLDAGYPNLTAAQKEQLKPLLTANGRSYSDPILTADGQVDADASRRVMFKFRLTDEQMIEQMRSILEGAQGGN